MTLTWTLLPQRYTVCRLDTAEAIPQWATSGELFSITRTRDELSIICEDANVPDGLKVSRGWRCFALQGPFAFTEIGIAAAFTSVLAAAGVGVLVVSTYDTDLVLVAERDVDAATAALRNAGHRL